MAVLAVVLAAVSAAPNGGSPQDGITTRPNDALGQSCLRASTCSACRADSGMVTISCLCRSAAEQNGKVPAVVARLLPRRPGCLACPCNPLFLGRRRSTLLGCLPLLLHTRFGWLSMLSLILKWLRGSCWCHSGREGGRTCDASAPDTVPPRRCCCPCACSFGRLPSAAFALAACDRNQFKTHQLMESLLGSEADH